MQTLTSAQVPQNAIKPVSIDTARLIAARIAPATAKNYRALLARFA